jgi:hypothetical protein
MSVAGSVDDSSLSRSVLAMINVKLDRTNFFQWESLIKPYLTARKLAKFISRTDGAVVVGANGLMLVQNAHYNDLPADDAVARERFESDAAHVLLILRSSLSESILSITMGYDTPWSLFYILEQHCKPQQTADWQELTDIQMRIIRMKDKESINSLFSRFMNAFRNRAAAHGSDVSDAQKSFLFFNALPDSGSWGEWKRVNKHLSRTFGENYSIASNHELQINASYVKNDVGSSSSSSAVAPVYSAAENKNKGEKKCWHCGKVGHEKKDCRKLMNEIRQKGQSNGSGAGKPTCNYCKKIGHVEDKCWKKQNKYGKKEQAALADGTGAFDRWCMFSGVDQSSSIDDKFYLDSGASRHLCGNRSFLHNIHPLSSPVPIQIADGRTVIITEEGEVHLNTPSGGRFIKNVALYEGGGSNLISVGALADKFKGSSIIFTDTNGTISDKNGKVLFESDRVGRSLYAVRCSVRYPSSVSASCSPVERIQMLSDADLSLWH